MPQYRRTVAVFIVSNYGSKNIQTRIIYQYNIFYICIEIINNMTLQQFEYIVAVDRYGYFVAAAESCGVTQSTLSLMVRKLEDELDVRIFNRDTHPVEVTEAGRMVIDRAKMILYHCGQLLEGTKSERELLSGTLRVAMISSVAPILIPGMFRFIRNNHPSIDLRVEEMLSSTIIAQLRKGEVDMGIVSSPVREADMLELPLYHESFMAYVSPQEPAYSSESIRRSDVLDNPLWIIRDGVRLFDRSMLRPGERFEYDAQYEGGRVGMLIQLINENGGMAIIPETHVNLILRSWQAHIRPIVDPVPMRTVSLVFRKDYIHEQLLNVMVDAVKTIIPSGMREQVIKGERIKL